MGIFSDVIIPDEVYPFPLTFSRYNKLVTHFVSFYYILHLNKKERKSSYGKHIYPQNSNNESKQDSAYSKKIN